MSQKQKSNESIAVNRKARHEFSLEEHFEAGIALHGWEVKSLRAGRVQLDQSYVIVKNSEAYLFGCQITPLQTASTHITPDPLRNRKLLLHARELSKLIGSVERKGYTLIPLALYWKNNHVKLDIALAKGKKLHDKRSSHEYLSG
jgi:SsrA-binding protein